MSAILPSLLRKYRSEECLTQTGAAYRIGATYGTWGSWERSVTIPFQRRHVEPLAAVLGMSVEDLEQAIDHDLRTVSTLRDVGKPSVNRALIRASVTPERGSRLKVAMELGISPSSITNHAPGYHDYFNKDKGEQARQDHLDHVPKKETADRLGVSVEWVQMQTRSLPRWTKVNEQSVCSAYEDGRRCRCIADEFGISDTAVRNVLKRRGVALVAGRDQWTPNMRQFWSSPDRWAKGWDACQECGTTDRPCKNATKGLCSTCHHREYRRRPDARTKIAAREAARTARRRAARRKAKSNETVV